MSQQYQEIGDDEVRSFFGGAPVQQASPQMVQQPLTSAPPARPVPPPSVDLKANKPDMKSMVQSVLETQELMKQRPVAEAKSVADDALNFVTQNWEAFAIPPAVIAGSWLLNKIGGESGGEKKSYADRIFRIGAPKDNLASPQSTNKVDPVMDTNSPYQKPDIDMSKLSVQDRELIARSEQNRISKERELEMKRMERQQAAVDRINNVNSSIGNPTPKTPNPIPDVVAMTAPAEVPTVADIGKQALGVAPVETPPAVQQVASEAVVPLGEEKATSGRKKGSKNLTEAEKIARKGGLPGMTKEEAGMRGHLLGMYGGKENPAAQQAYEQVKEILGYTPAYEQGKGGSLKPEETAKIKGWQKENMAGPKITLTHDMKKVLKTGGPAAVAALALLPEFVNASPKEKQAIANELGFDLSTGAGLAAILGGPPAIAAAAALGSSGLNKQEERQLQRIREQEKQMALLGSPYASAPWSVQQRKNQSVGFAPPR